VGRGLQSNETRLVQSQPVTFSGSITRMGLSGDWENRPERSLSMLSGLFLFLAYASALALQPSMQ
jgi:hypothetical protein